jgi:hypothetical protein
MAADAEAKDLRCTGPAFICLPLPLYHISLSIIYRDGMGPDSYLLPGLRRGSGTPPGREILFTLIYPRAEARGK